MFYWANHQRMSSVRSLLCLFVLIGLCGTTHVGCQTGRNDSQRVWLLDATAFSDTAAPEECAGRVEFTVSNDGLSQDGSLCIHVPTDCPPMNWYQYSYTMTGVRPGQLYEVTADVKADNVVGGVGASVAFSYLASEPPHERVAFYESNRLTKPLWGRVAVPLFVPEGHDRIMVQLTLNGTGTAWFDNVELRLISERPGLEQVGGRKPVHVAVTDDVTTPDFLGFGVEDDAFWYTENLWAERGITEAEAEERSARIAELDPKVIATLFWWDAISPTRDINAITYDTELLRAMYETFERHQKADRRIFFGDVFWGWSKEAFPYSDQNVEQGVEILFDLLHHLIVEKGFTCIKYVCISGEVDMVFESLGGSFESYLKATRLLRTKLDEAGLTDVVVMGDKSGGFEWFQRALKENGDVFDIYTVHEYPFYQLYPVINFRYAKAKSIVQELIDPIGSDRSGRPVYTPVFSYEIGYLDPKTIGSVTMGSLMSDYDYGLYCAYTCTAILNEGIVGGSVWCLHSMYYPFDNMMDFGLWDYRDNDWKLRPIYHAYGLFSRFAARGMKPLAVRHSPNFYDFQAAALEDDDGRRIFYAVNLANSEVEAEVTGLSDGAYSVYMFTQENIPSPGDADYRKLDALRCPDPWMPGNRLTIPPRSLVMLR